MLSWFLTSYWIWQDRDEAREARITALENQLAALQVEEDKDDKEGCGRADGEYPRDDGDDNGDERDDLVDDLDDDEADDDDADGE